ncbi:uncharacterized protein LOC101454712 [Ceratitis capitata]|uniref:Regulatory protein zeste n=2 Tax=Ceratitis capitata TaxID=7213 RepID=A0A811VF82_CERCA|nr:uncharacterized protein LOC101454712 [Ceratitis capitata]CAD7013907.1 unnamed protein product [Ceratitis capitata]
MDRRKKRTSTSQYMMYLDMMEKDSIFATGRIPRDVESNYLQKKWKELSDKLNTCNSGPTLTAEEWRKRLNDWKNTTRCKYRRSISGEKDISLTSLELKALDLFGKVPNTTADPVSITLKSEKEDAEEEEVEYQRTSESLQKELQAAVEEAICGDDDEDGMHDESDEQEITSNVQTTSGNTASVANVGTTTTYRTIVVENAQFTDDEQNQDHLEFITQRRHTLGPSSQSTNAIATAVQTMVTAAPPHPTTVTKLINGEMPLKRLRTQPPTEQVVYEVKKAPMSHQHQQPRTITIHNTAVPHADLNSNSASHVLGVSSVPINDAREIARQLKRLADIKAEKLKFEIARFKFNNPGFVYHSPTL